MKKLDKKDFLCCFILVFFFVTFVLIVTRFKYYYGSTLDWETQHSLIPDYFRTLFYKTGDFLPDFGFNLGNGQNIYNLSYYGLLSPIILLSYLLPFISMPTYLGISSIICVISSAILFYIWLRKNHGGKYLSSFLSSFALMFAVSLSFHSHRHIMFMNYMPFLILGLFGVDKRLTNRKGWLLTLCVFLMIMTSYYYSVAGIICLILYGVYKYIRINKKIKFKKFLLDGFKFMLPILVGVICSAVIIVPTFFVILNGRGETFNSITLRDLIMPGINIKYVMYGSYGMGLTSILLLSIINLFFKKRENLFLGIVLSLIIVFPILNYILNATMYIDSKSLIPLLPLAVYSIFLFLEACIGDKINFKFIYGIMLVLTLCILFQGSIAKAFLADFILLSICIFLFRYFKVNVLLIIPCILIPFATSLYATSLDSLVEKKSFKEHNNGLSSVIDKITNEDRNIYRIDNLENSVRNMNNLYSNIDYYSSTLYSSTYNMGYNKFYYDVINNSIQSRNRVITSASTNIMFLMFSGSKYLLKSGDPFYGYDLYDEIDGVKIYKSDDVLPVLYARSDVISEKGFESLEYPAQSEALLNNVIVEDSSDAEFKSHVEKIDIDLNKINFKNVKVTKKDNYYLLEALDNGKGDLDLLDDLRNKILFVRFKMIESAACKDGDTYIKINDVKNKLTCKEWKYHNQNYDFDYVLSTTDLKSLSIDFSRGVHKISNIEVFALDYDYIRDIRSGVDEFKFDKDNTRGDFIEGDINVKKDGYFVTSIPYDKGFKIEVDGLRTEYVKVNKGFVGFKIGKGDHHINIEYKAPFKNISLVISLFGIVMFIVLAIFENFKFNEKKIS